MFRKKPSGFFWSTFFKRGAGGCSFLPLTRPAAPSGSAAVGAAPPPQRGCHRHHRVSCSPGTGTGRLDGFASSNCGLDARRYVPQSLHRGTRKVYNCDCDCLICGAAGLLLGSKRLSARRSSFLSRSPLNGFFLFFLFFLFFFVAVLHSVGSRGGGGRGNGAARRRRFYGTRQRRRRAATYRSGTSSQRSRRGARGQEHGQRSQLPKTFSGKFQRVTV